MICCQMWNKQAKTNTDDNWALFEGLQEFSCNFFKDKLNFQ